MRRSTLLVLLCTFILAACGSRQVAPPENGMIEAIRYYETGMLNNDINLFMSAVCRQDMVAAKAKFNPQDQPVKHIGAYDASGIVFDMEQDDGNVALVNVVSGEGIIHLSSGNIVGPQEINLPELSNRIVFKKEDGSWKVCFGAADELKPTPASDR